MNNKLSVGFDVCMYVYYVCMDVCILSLGQYIISIVSKSYSNHVSKCLPNFCIYVYVICTFCALYLCALSLQGDSRCSTVNGVQQKGKMLSDAQLFDGEFGNLVSELTEQDFTDPVLTDALNRLREVK